MKHFCVFLGMLALPVLAQQDSNNPPGVDWEQLRAQATELRGRAKQMRTQADRTRTDAESLCHGKLLVSDCMVDARKARSTAERMIRQIEQEAVGIDRRLRAHDYEVKLQQRAEKDREREIKAAERAEEIRRKDEKRRLKDEQRLARERQRKQRDQSARVE